MRIMVAPVSSVAQYAASLKSLYHVKTRAGDSLIDDYLKYSSRGDISRVELEAEFLQSDYDAVWLVDADMKFQPDCLEVLRETPGNMVCGHYYKRKQKPVESVIALSDDLEWPYYPMMDTSVTGVYHGKIDGRQIMNCGMGNVLIRRCVIEDVRKILPPGQSPFSLGPIPEATNGDHGTFGADFRFFWYARRAGHKITLNMNKLARAKHGAVFWVDDELYDIMYPYQYDLRAREREKTFFLTRRFHGMDHKAAQDRIRVLEENLQKIRALYSNSKKETELFERQIDVIEGQLAERRFDLELEKKHPSIPVFKTREELEAALAERGKGFQGKSVEDVAESRNKIYQNEGAAFADMVNDKNNDAVQSAGS